MDKLTQILQGIKSLKIQGATNIAKEALKVLLEVDEKDLNFAIDQLKNTRPTESMLFNCLELIRLKGKSMIEPTLARLNDNEEEIVKNSLSLFKDKTTVLTHCHSSTVAKILKRAHEKGISLKVYLTETRPLFQGRITANELVKEGISSTMITDSEAAFLVSHHDQREIDFILFGADVITKDGGAINKVGSYGIALSSFEAKIPLYIAATFLKFSPQELEIEERKSNEVWPEKPKGLEILNPAFDFIPSKFIASFISEFGIISPDKVLETVKKNYPWIVKISKPDFSAYKRSSQTSPYKLYLHLLEKIDLKENIIAEYLLNVEEGEDFDEVAGGVAAESSIGTWTKVKTEAKKVFNKLHARVFEADKKSGKIKIAYPLDLFEKGNIPQLLSSIAGNIFGLKEIKNLKLVDIFLPEKYVCSFPGPAFGVEGIRKIVGIFDRPLIGCIIKPKLGLTSKEHAQVAREVFEGGIDFIKDDENLTSQVFNPFEDRVKELLKTCYHFFKNGKIYAFNVTGTTETMLERTKYLKEKGGNCLMIDFLTAGFAGLQSLRNHNFNLIIHGHRAMHAAFDRLPNHGISMMVLAKLARLSGIDSLHTGTVVGKMEGGSEEITKINKFLLTPWYGLKPVLPVASGGLYPGLIPLIVKILGKDILLNFGGGIHGHPKGSKAGAVAVLKAVEATIRGISLFEYSKKSKELALALSKWGRK